MKLIKQRREFNLAIETTGQVLFCLYNYYCDEYPPELSKKIWKLINELLDYSRSDDDYINNLDIEKIKWIEERYYRDKPKKRGYDIK